MWQVRQFCFVHGCNCLKSQYLQISNLALYSYHPVTRFPVCGRESWWISTSWMSVRKMKNNAKCATIIFIQPTSNSASIDKLSESLTANRPIL